MQAHIKLETRLLPVLVAILLILQIAVPYRGWWILLIALGGLWLITALWARALAAGLHIRREVQSGLVQVGARIEERFTLLNDSRLPALWVEADTHTDLPSDHAGLVTTLSGKRSLRWQKRSTCTRRGLFTLGPTTLKAGDPFGLYTVTLHYPATTPLTVLPPLIPIPFFHITPGGQLQIGEGRPQVDASRFTVSASGVREYQPGDSLRWIHWRTSARHDSLFVRIFEGNLPSTSWWILLDLEQQVQAGHDLDATDEHAIVLAASLADQGLRAGRAVGLAAHGRETVWMPPREGETQRWEILRALAQARRGDRSLDDLISRMQSAFAQNTSLVIITPSLEKAWVEATALLAERGAIPTVLLLDPLSYGGTGDARDTQTLLTELGISNYVVAHAMLDQIGIYPAASRDRQQQTMVHSSRISPQKTLAPPEPGWKVLS